MAGIVPSGKNPRRASPLSPGQPCGDRLRFFRQCRFVQQTARRGRSSGAEGAALQPKGRAAGQFERRVGRCGYCRRSGAAARVMPKMTFIERDGTRREVDAPLGMSVLEIARRHDIDIEGACEGSLACSTCHVIVDPQWYELLTEASEDEEDMLDLAFNLTVTSRLGCQIVITEELDGLTVELPAATRNLLLG